MAKIQLNDDVLKSLGDLGTKLAVPQRGPSDDLRAEARNIKAQLLPDLTGVSRGACAACATCAACLIDGPIPDLEGAGLLGLAGLID